MSALDIGFLMLTVPAVLFLAWVLRQIAVQYSWGFATVMFGALLWVLVALALIVAP